MYINFISIQKKVEEKTSFKNSKEASDVIAEEEE
jgi:hypothetical protein